MRHVSVLGCVVAFFLMWGVSMPALANTDLRASDVFMSSRWERPDVPAMLKLYGANRLVWVYSTNPDFVAQVHIAGATVTGALNAGNTDLGLAGACVDLQGQPLVAPWQRNFYPVRYWGDATNPLREQQLLQSVADSMASGVDGIHVDDWRMNYSALAWGGCFTDSSMAGFCTYLRGRFTADELAAMGVSDPVTFDFRCYLADRFGIHDQAGYQARASGIPLASHFREYALTQAKEMLASLVHEAARLAGGPVAFSMNGNFERTNDEHWFAADLVDYLVGESDAGPDGLLKLLTNLGMASGVGTPIVVSPRRPDQNPGALRQDIALTYALGHYFLVPWDVWLYDSVRFYPEPKEYVHLYRFIRQHKRLFDGYENPAVVGLLVNTATDSPILAGCARELLKRNIPYAVVPVGGHYVSLPVDAGFLGRFQYLVGVSDASALPVEVAQAVQEAVVGGTILLDRAEFARQLRQSQFAGQLATVEVEGAGEVYAVKRVQPGTSSAPVVFHILNRAYDQAADAVLPARNVSLHFPERVLPGRSTARAVLYAPEPGTGEWPGSADTQMPGLVLPVRATARGMSVTLPELHEWAIVTLE